jgi:hypothetical protein
MCYPQGTADGATHNMALLWTGNLILRLNIPEFDTIRSLNICQKPIDILCREIAHPRWRDICPFWSPLECVWHLCALSFAQRICNDLPKVTGGY